MQVILDTDGTPIQKSDRLGAVLAWLVLLTILVHATQGTLSRGGGQNVQRPGIGLADVLLACAFAAWFARRILRRDWSWPGLPLAALLGVIWLGLSVAASYKRGGASGTPIRTILGGLKDVIQFAEYFVVGVIVFAEVLRVRNWRRWAIAFFAFAAIIVLVRAYWQYCSADVAVMGVRAGFGNRNVLGAFLALAIPFLYGVGVSGRSCLVWLCTLIMTAVALSLVLAGGAFIGICAGILLIAAFRGPWRFFVTAAALLLFISLVIPGLRRPNADILMDSVMLYKEADTYHTLDRTDAPDKLQKWTAALGDSPSEADLSYVWQQRYKEWQVALQMMRKSPVFGVGVGAYQEKVNTSYENVPQPD